jgi:hypothetical protein
MKTGWAVIAGLGAAGLLVAAIPARAEEKAQAGQTAPQPGAQEPTAGQPAGKGELTGKVEKIDHQKQTLTLAGKELKLSDSTTVTKDGKAATHMDIKEGDEVRASFSPDTLQVRSIDVKAAGAAEPAEPGKKPAETPPSR